MPTTSNDNPENNLSFKDIVRPQNARRIAPELAYVLRSVPTSDPLLGRLSPRPELLRPVKYANGWALHDDVRLAWVKLEKGLALVSELLLTLRNSKEASCVVRSTHWSFPSTFGYQNVHRTPQRASAAIRSARLAMVILAGRVSMGVALWQADIPELDVVPAWISLLRKEAIPETWIDALQSSAISRFAHGLRPGAIIEPNQCIWLDHIPCYQRAKLPVFIQWPSKKSLDPQTGYPHLYPQVAPFLPPKADVSLARNTPPRPQAPDIYMVFANGTGKPHPYERATELRLRKPPSGPYQRPAEKPAEFRHRMEMLCQKIVLQEKPFQKAARLARTAAADIGEGPRPWTRVYVWQKVKDVFPDAFREWQELDYRGVVAASAVTSVWATYPPSARWYNPLFDEWDLCLEPNTDLNSSQTPVSSDAHPLPNYVPGDRAVFHDDVGAMYPDEDPTASAEVLTFPDSSRYLRERYGLVPTPAARGEHPATYDGKTLYKLFALPREDMLPADLDVQIQYAYWTWHMLGCPGSRSSGEAATEPGEIREHVGRSRQRQVGGVTGGSSTLSWAKANADPHADNALVTGSWPCWDLNLQCPAFLLTSTLRANVRWVSTKNVKDRTIYRVRYLNDPETLAWELAVDISTLLYLLRRFPDVRSSTEAVQECVNVGASYYTVVAIATGEIPPPSMESTTTLPEMYRHLEDGVKVSDISLGLMDYRAYRVRAMRLLTGATQIRAALGEGNIVWRIVTELLSSNQGVLHLAHQSCIQGPLLGKGDLSHANIFPPSSTTSYLDNVLTPAEADILCGVCRVYGRKIS